MGEAVGLAGALHLVNAFMLNIFAGMPSLRKSELLSWSCDHLQLVPALVRDAAVDPCCARRDQMIRRPAGVALTRHVRYR
jgi:hypothetical protein